MSTNFRFRSRFPREGFGNEAAILADCTHEIVPDVPIPRATASADQIGADPLMAAGITEVVHRPLVSDELASAWCAFAHFDAMNGGARAWASCARESVARCWKPSLHSPEHRAQSAKPPWRMRHGDYPASSILGIVWQRRHPRVDALAHQHFRHADANRVGLESGPHAHSAAVLARRPYSSAEGSPG